MLLQPGLGAEERRDVRGTLDSDHLVHSLILLLINLRLWAGCLASPGLSVCICNMGVMVAASL